MDCEVCGRSGARIDAVIEDAKMRVCDNCSRLSKQVLFIEPQVVKERRQVKKTEIELELVDDFDSVIKSARERLGLTRKELGALIDVKESLLKHIEEGRSPPTEAVAAKLEKQLRIKLYEPVPVETGGAKRSGGAGGVTLGDIVDVKKKLSTK
jgi:putative transcription factor